MSNTGLTSVKSLSKKRPLKDYFLTVLKVGAIAGICLATYNGLKTTQLFNKVSQQIDTEVLITLAAAGVGAVWKFYTDNEKTKLETAQTSVTANAQAIKALETRIDWALTQVQDILSSQTDDSQNIKKLDEKINKLTIEMYDNRIKTLNERLELVKSFYQEINELHSHISVGSLNAQTLHDNKTSTPTLSSEEKEV